MTQGGRSPRKIALSVLAVAALALTACSGTPASSGGNGGGGYGDNLTIVMVTHGSASDPAWSVVKRGADQAAKDLGVTVDYQAPQTGNAVEQGKLVSAAIGKKPAGMVVTIPDPDAMVGPIKSAVDAGIPVSVINIGLDNYKDLGALNFIGVNLKDSGSAGGKRLAESGVKNGLCVNHAASAVVLEQMCDGFIDEVTKAGGKGKRIAVDGANASDAERAIQAALTEDPTIDGIFTLGALGFSPASEAIAKTRGDQIKIGTFDTPATILESVQEGKALFAIDQQLYLQGYLSVQTLAQNARYGLHSYDHISTGPNFVTKDDAERVIKLNAEGVR
jgi:simple sugar transport system substrate-binding protein